MTDQVAEVKAKYDQVAGNIAAAREGDPKAYLALFNDGVEAANIIGETLKTKEVHHDDTATLTFILAPSFGGLTKDGVKKMDELLMSSCAFAKKELEKNLQEKGSALSWEDVTKTMNQCEALHARGPPTAKADTLSYESTNWFKFDGSEDAAKVNEVQKFLTNLIGDEDICISVGIKDTERDMSEDPSRGQKMEAMEVIRRIIACTGAAVENVATFVHKRVEETKTLLDVGILRYPDISKPYVNVYRVKLEATRVCDRTLAVEKNKSSLYAEINAQEYEPNEEVLKAVKPEVIKSAVASLESMF